MYGFDLFQNFGTQFQLDTINIFLELIHRRGSNDIATQKWLVIDKSQSHFSQRQTVPLCNIQVPFGSFIRLGAIVSGHLFEPVEPGIVIGVTLMVFP